MEGESALNDGKKTYSKWQDTTPINGGKMIHPQVAQEEHHDETLREQTHFNAMLKKT